MCSWGTGRRAVHEALLLPGAAASQGVLKALNVNKLTKCGVTFKFW